MTTINRIKTLGTLLLALACSTVLTSASGNSPCGGLFDGFVSLTNGGNGYTATGTTCVTSVLVDGVAWDTAYYTQQWRRTVLVKGCSSAASSTTMTHASVIGAKYTYSVYFVPGHVPSTNSVITLQIAWF